MNFEVQFGFETGFWSENLLVNKKHTKLEDFQFLKTLGKKPGLAMSHASFTGEILKKIWMCLDIFFFPMSGCI